MWLVPEIIGPGDEQTYENTGYRAPINWDTEVMGLVNDTDRLLLERKLELHQRELRFQKREARTRIRLGGLW